MTAGTFGWDRYGPMSLGIAVMTVDTTDGYDPALDEIVEFARTG